MPPSKASKLPIFFEILSLFAFCFSRGGLISRLKFETRERDPSAITHSFSFLFIRFKTYAEPMPFFTCPCLQLIYRSYNFVSRLYYLFYPVSVSCAKYGATYFYYQPCLSHLYCLLIFFFPFFRKFQEMYCNCTFNFYPFTLGRKKWQKIERNRKKRERKKCSISFLLFSWIKNLSFSPYFFSPLLFFFLLFLFLQIKHTVSICVLLFSTTIV